MKTHGLLPECPARVGSDVWTEIQCLSVLSSICDLCYITLKFIIFKKPLSQANPKVLEIAKQEQMTKKSSEYVADQQIVI